MCNSIELIKNKTKTKLKLKEKFNCIYKRRNHQMLKKKIFFFSFGGFLKQNNTIPSD